MNFQNNISLKYKFISLKNLEPEDEDIKKILLKLENNQKLGNQTFYQFFSKDSFYLLYFVIDKIITDMFKNYSTQVENQKNDPQYCDNYSNLDETHEILQMDEMDIENPEIIEILFPVEKESKILKNKQQVEKKNIKELVTILNSNLTNEIMKGEKTFNNSTKRQNNAKYEYLFLNETIQLIKQHMQMIHQLCQRHGVNFWNLNQFLANAIKLNNYIENRINFDIEKKNHEMKNSYKLSNDYFERIKIYNLPIVKSIYEKFLLNPSRIDVSNISNQTLLNQIIVNQNTFLDVKMYLKSICVKQSELYEKTNLFNTIVCMYINKIYLPKLAFDFKSRTDKKSQTFFEYLEKTKSELKMINIFIETMIEKKKLETVFLIMETLEKVKQIYHFLLNHG